MIIWNRYAKSDGEWAEVGAFILEASVNGSWVVRHKMAAIPSQASVTFGLTRAEGINGAKAECERVLLGILERVNKSEPAQLIVNLCKRYQAMRILQLSSTSIDEMNLAALDLDERVSKYLSAQ